MTIIILKHKILEMRYLLGMFLITILASCGGSGTNAPAPTPSNLTGFLSEKINGSNAELASKKDGAGLVIEKGIIRDGKKDGVFMTYHSNGRIKTIGSYVNDQLNGVYLELSDREQVDSKTNYLNGVLHGPHATYKFGRPTLELAYKNGVQEGPFTEYSDRGKISKSGTFKAGKLDGTMKFFDDEENLTMEFEYKDGEKVSGGIIEK